MMGNAEVNSQHATELWRHATPTSTRMWGFLQHINSRHRLALDGYPALHRWSVDNVAAFWEEVWHFVGIRASRTFDEVLAANAPMWPRPDFFAGCRLNFAENLLFPAKAEVVESATAVIAATELEGRIVRTSWGELREAVRRCSTALRAAGLREGQVVAGYVSNHLEALVAVLSAASLGAIWSGISPDNGVSAVLDRLIQIRPCVLFVDDGMLYNGKPWSSAAKTADIVSSLVPHGLQLVIVIKALGQADPGLDDIASRGVRVDEYQRFLDSASSAPLSFAQLPPSHPLYVLYSSGTTGLPKAIVHTALGTLIQHKKEHVLHCSLNPSSIMLYYTTTSWMMHHWMVSSLAVGTTLVLYTGSPFQPRSHLSLPCLLSELGVTHFGTSAAYLTALEMNDVYPASSIDLSCLEAIFSTASPLPPSTFRFVYRAFPSHVHLASITGGTDIISLFGAPCPLLPVHVGEIQCAGLGMDISAVDSHSGARVPPGMEGDLVCLKPFPCQPLTFFGPGGDAKYRSAYFDRFPGVWHHGDFIRVNPATGGLLMLGRSDGVLKPAGVRFGSAEIYNVLTRLFPGEVEDALCVGRRRPEDKDETVCLFLVMCTARRFDEDVAGRVRSAIRKELSPRHVPGVVEECGCGIPKTGNGKKIEVAVKQILSGIAVETNASVVNPEALDWFRRWARSQR